MVKARYEALAKDGGARAVNKAIFKKQKKLSQSDKKSRPGGRPLKKQKNVGNYRG